MDKEAGFVFGLMALGLFVFIGAFLFAIFFLARMAWCFAADLIWEWKQPSIGVAKRRPATYRKVGR